MTKGELLAQLKKKMDADQTLPLRAGATQLVFGEGNPDAQIYFLGEAPGYFEDREGRPFVGLAGRLLNELVESIGLARSDVYISNVVRFRPPANRDPEPDEIAAFAPYVDEEIAIIDPKIIVTLGRFSMGKFLPEARISGVHGRKFRVDFQGIETTIMPMYHPAAALRSTQVMEAIKVDFQKIRDLLEGRDGLEGLEGMEGMEEAKKDEGASQLTLI